VSTLLRLNNKQANKVLLYRCCQWPRGLGRRSVTACLLRLWTRIPPEAWMFDVMTVLSSDRGLCDGLITRPEETFRLWCVIVCDLETSWMRRHILRCAAAPPAPTKKGALLSIVVQAAPLETNTSYPEPTQEIIGLLIWHAITCRSFSVLYQLEMCFNVSLRIF